LAGISDIQASAEALIFHPTCCAVKRPRTARAAREAEGPGNSSAHGNSCQAAHDPSHDEHEHAGGSGSDLRGWQFHGFAVDPVGENDDPSPSDEPYEPHPSPPPSPLTDPSDSDDASDDGRAYAPEGFLNEILDGYDDEHPLFVDFMDLMEELEAEPSAASSGKSPESPLFPGSNLTVRAYAFVMLRMKSDGKIRDTAMDRLLAFTKHSLLPQPNDAPGSLHCLLKAIQAPSPDKYEYHVCMNGCCVFDTQLSSANYSNGKEDLCQCSPPTKRFKTVQRGVNEILLPHAKFWYFGLEKAIHRLFSDPAWCRLRKEWPSVPSSHVRQSCQGWSFIRRRADLQSNYS
jgi:hypothetical protein